AGALNLPARMSWWQWMQCLFCGADATPVPSWQRLHSNSPTSFLPWSALPGVHAAVWVTLGAALAAEGLGGGGVLFSACSELGLLLQPAKSIRPKAVARAKARNWERGGIDKGA